MSPFLYHFSRKINQYHHAKVMMCAPTWRTFFGSGHQTWLAGKSPGGLNGNGGRSKTLEAAALEKHRATNCRSLPIVQRKQRALSPWYAPHVSEHHWKRAREEAQNGDSLVFQWHCANLLCTIIPFIHAYTSKWQCLIMFRGKNSHVHDQLWFI
jgi:hypothetical protein